MIKAIFAVSVDGAFGNAGDLPWPYSKDDMVHFSRTTKNKTVVMGKGTWYSSMPTPLPNRRNIVVSSTMDKIDGCEVARSVTEVLTMVKDDPEVFIIGGAKLLWSMRDHITEVIMTIHHGDHPVIEKFDYEHFLHGFDLISGNTSKDGSLTFLTYQA
jgi:dihydrofolate reductase